MYGEVESETRRLLGTLPERDLDTVIRFFETLRNARTGRALDVQSMRPEPLKSDIDRRVRLKRRTFLTASLASAALATARKGVAQPTPAPNAREYYLIRRYQLQAGPQTKLVESYFGDALIPALTRMGMGPIGAFKLDYGPETPAFYLLIPGRSVEALAIHRAPAGGGCRIHEGGGAFLECAGDRPCLSAHGEHLAGGV